jgi:hypothetical protein
LRRNRRGGDEVGRVLARDRQPGEAAGELSRRHHQHWNEQIERAAAARKTAPQQDRRRHQIKHLHQRLRHEPGVAPQQRPLLAAQRAARRGLAKGDRWARMARRGADSAGRGHRVVGEARGDDRDGAGKQDGAGEQQRRERRAVAEHGARRPPRDAADIGREREHG